MLCKMERLLVLSLLLPTVVMADLTGTWSGDDGGTYYLRQTGNVVHWYGERANNNPAWANVYQGRIKNNRIKGKWVDVPKGQTMSRGTLRLDVRDNGNILVATQKTGGFGGSRWTRSGYVAVPQPTTAQEDCIKFNPATSQVKNISGRWKIVDGSHWVFDFGNKEGEARKSLRVIKHYNINRSCFVGRPDPSFTYLKRGGQAPSGQVSGEDCIGFNAAFATVKKINSRWKIVDGSHWMFDFGNKEGEARNSLNIIKHYGFTKTCYIGRPDPSFKYLRK